MTHPGNSEYVLVPREPTLDMGEAGMAAMCADEDAHAAEKIRDAWKAMLAASPTISPWHRIDDPVNPAREFEQFDRLISWYGFASGKSERYPHVSLLPNGNSLSRFPRAYAWMPVPKAAPLPPPPDEGG